MTESNRPSQRTIWRYDGQWSQVPDPLLELDDVPELDEALRRLGFIAADSWGLLDDISIYEYDGAERWMTAWSIDSSNIHLIEIYGLPNVLHVLAQFGQIAAGQVITHKAEELKDLIYNAAEDASAERQRRHGKHQ